MNNSKAREGTESPKGEPIFPSAYLAAQALSEEHERRSRAELEEMTEKWQAQYANKPSGDSLRSRDLKLPHHRTYLDAKTSSVPRHLALARLEDTPACVMYWWFFNHQNWRCPKPHGEKQMKSERRFPIQSNIMEFRLGRGRREVSATTVPWSEAEIAYQTYAAAGHGDQSLEDLARRGGFGRFEFAFLRAGFYLRSGGYEMLLEHPPVTEFAANPEGVEEKNDVAT